MWMVTLLKTPRLFRLILLIIFLSLFRDYQTVFVELMMVRKFIPSLVSPLENEIFISMPSLDVIKQTIFALDSFSFPGSNGFSGEFFL